ncbi:MAG: class I SAM-dependent methyltransferase [Dehalococcoidales bacterium]|nr:class I SAM-dependent methyltransferase [Dehalococcoidales bacterium]
MKQNIYDQPGFFRGYQRMREKQQGFNEILERLSMLSLLPEVRDFSVLDLGCGAGDLSRSIKALGAETVIGVDISINMIKLAKKDLPDGITFLNSPMEDLEFSPGMFDLAVSSLAFHYVADLPALFRNIYSWLKTPGMLLFSIEHPLITCAQGIHHGWIKDTSGNKVCWPVDCYSSEGKRESHWFVKGVIKYHRTISGIINACIGAGFSIKRIMEPVASQEEEKNWPNLAEAKRRPPYLLVKAVK